MMLPQPKALVLLAAITSLLAAAFLVGHNAGRGSPVGHNGLALPETLYVAAKAETDTVRVTIREQVVRWQVDTLWRSDTVTVNDTVRVLIPAPTLARMDSTIRACATLDTLVTRERSACERVQTALRDSIRTLQPSKWRHLRDASLLVGGIILGAKVIR